MSPSDQEPVFIRSRFEELPNAEIAQKLNISIRTFEKPLRNTLAVLEFFTMLFLMMHEEPMRNSCVVLKSIWNIAIPSPRGRFLF